jgi:hypothetical protein
MKRWTGCLVVGVIVVVLGGVGLLWTGPAQAIEGLSGSTWGTTLYNFGHDDLQTMGSLNQGIDWFEKHGYRFTTFAALRWRYQSNEGQSFNAWGPALGASIKKGPVRFGAEYYWEQKQLSPNSDRALLFVDWYYDWDLLKLFR